MHSNSQSPDEPDAALGNFQYSLQSMFIAMTIVAILCSLLFPGPRWVMLVTLAFLATAVPAALAIIVVYGGGYLRTFAIGALFPAGAILQWFSLGWRWIFFSQPVGILSTGPIAAEERLYIAISITAAFLMIVAVGLLAVGVRWAVESSQRQRRQHQEPPADEPLRQDA